MAGVLWLEEAVELLCGGERVERDESLARGWHKEGHCWVVCEAWSVALWGPGTSYECVVLVLCSWPGV